MLVADLVAVLAIFAVVALWVVGTARRLDRLHARVDAAAAALDAQLRRRDELILQWARGVRLRKLARRVGAAAFEAIATPGLGRDREVAENTVVRALSGVLVAVRPADDVDQEMTQLHDETLRARFACRFYNDTVRDALLVRDRRVVRWLGLAGHAPLPAYFEMADDELPWERIQFAPRRTIEG
ncbi:MAG TPA: NUDIX hydrolase [Mycobacteriales bacterium]|nr:NUDIX hydrolase [Mycobacteriales bacterium]